MMSSVSDYGQKLTRSVSNLSANSVGSLKMEDLGSSLKDGLGALGSMSVKGFDRAKQFSQEKMGSAVKTEYDQEFAALSGRVETTRTCVNNTSTAARNFLQPNVSARLEDMFNEKVTVASEINNANLADLASYIPHRKGSAVDKRQSYSETLGATMKTGGMELGELAIGQTLLEVGSTFQKIGMLEREYLGDVYAKFFKPFNSHLQMEWGTIAAEKRRLDLARLDLDAAKSKVRGARTPEAMQANEQKVRESQAAFDRQFEQTKILLTDADRKSSEFCVYLEEFIRSQMVFHEQAHKLLEEAYTSLKK